MATAIAGVEPARLVEATEAVELNEDEWDNAGKEELILNIADLEEAGKKKMSKVAREYLDSGSTDEFTYRANPFAFDKYLLRPRVLVDVSKADASIELFGRKIPFPCCVAPTAFHKIVHAEGEPETARGVGAAGLIMGLSSYASTLWEDVAQAGREGREGGMDFVAQLYINPDKEALRKLVKKAENIGCKAIFLTSDAPVLGTRWKDTRNAFHSWFLPRFRIANVEEVVDPSEPLVEAASHFQDISHSWERDIPFLRSITELQIFIKGVLTAEDTLKAIEYGVDGMIVSNHGGRQLDGVPATMDVLAECVDAADGRIPVFVDGGFRRGSDIFKAIALGAKCVWVGRPVLWGLAYDGHRGVELALKMLKEEFLKTMQLIGCNSVAKIDRAKLGVLNSRGFFERLDKVHN